MTEFRKWWGWISACGTQPEFHEHFNRKIILGNRIAALAGVIVIVFSIFYKDYPAQLFTYLSSSVFCFLFILLNYLGLVKFSRLFFMLSVPVFVVIGASMAPESVKSAQKIALIATITIPLVLFGISEMRPMVLGIVWTVGCFVAFDYLDFKEIALPDSHAMTPKVVEYVCATVSFSMFIATYIYLQKLNVNAEDQLKTLLQKSNEQKDEIEVQNEKLEVINRNLNIRALSAELNPHFLYNSLNSVQHFLSINDKTSSLNYLSKFGRLIRQFIDYSDDGVIPLSDELKLLKYYLELESLRFESMFTYSLEVEEELLLHNIFVPLLLVQIHIENAILHGLMNKQGDRSLKVTFRKEEETMLCVIEDNGIGREASSRVRRVQHKEHQSKGIEISTKRLNLMYPHMISSDLVNIVDLYDESRLPAGTRVRIRIPFEII